jgi:hypothetical protein
MNRILTIVAVVSFVLAMAAPAWASGTEVTVGADLTTISFYKDNYDYNDGSKDAISATAEFVHLYVDNFYTEKVSTHIEISLYNPIMDMYNTSLELAQGYIKVEEFLDQNITIMVGKMSVKWQLRPTWGAGTFENIYPYGVNSAFVINMNIPGIYFKYDFNENVALTLGWYKILENSVAGNNANDIDLYLVRLDYKLQQNSKFFAAFLFFDDQYDKGTVTKTLIGNMWVLNAGIDYFLNDEALELYAELAYQGGTTYPGQPDLGSVAIDMGAEYTFAEQTYKPYIGLDITYYQGTKSGTPGTAAYNHFGSDWTHTLIAENDFASNNLASLSLWAPGWVGVKLMGGMKSMQDDKIALDFIFAWFSANGDMPGGRGKGLGYEFDAVGSYMFTNDLVFSVGVGYFKADKDLNSGASTDGTWLALFSCTITF